jgi:hypothetical protein
MSWKITPGWSPADADAAAYITAVETADNQALENGVKVAIDNFVLGCKADGIWPAIKASCILAGARTLAGALVPLVGAAPTNVGGLFVSGDYNRKTGLVGDGSTKYLDSNRNNNDDPQNSKHIGVYTSDTATNSPAVSVSYAGASSISGSTHLSRLGTGFLGSRLNSATGFSSTSQIPAVGFIGLNRSDGSSYTARNGGTVESITAASASPTGGDLLIFGGISVSNARLAFYSIGESLNLALLDARVTTLINAFAAAIA